MDDFGAWDGVRRVVMRVEGVEGSEGMDRSFSL